MQHIKSHPAPNFDIRNQWLGLVTGILAVFALSIYFLANSALNHDVSWLLYVTQKTQQGAQLYVDYVQLNPPLINWLYSPAVWLSVLSGWSIGAAFKAYILLLSVMSILLSARIIRFLNIKNRTALLVLIGGVLTILPSWEFGQREHLMVILTLPYLFLTMARTQSVSLPKILIMFTALAAATGFCIKPYFLLVPACLELFLLFKLGFGRTLRRPEPYIFTAVVLGYLASIWIFTPAYFSDVFGFGLEVYGAGFNVGWSRLAFGFSVTILVISTSYMWARTRQRNLDETVFPVFIVAGIAMLIVFLAQKKGYMYHLLPASSYVLIACGGLIIHHWNLKLEEGRTRALTTGIAIGLMASVFVASMSSFKTNDRNMTKFEPVLAAYPQASSIFIMSDNLRNGFPLVTEKGLTWGSRFPSLWLVDGVHVKRRTLGGDRPNLDEIERYNWQATAEDLMMFKPDLILVDKNRSDASQHAQYDYVENFSRNEAFRENWTHYEKTGDASGFDIYLRSSN